MLASSFCASRPRDAMRRMSPTELVFAAPSQQRLRRSFAAALQPIALNWSFSSCPSSRGDASCAQHQLRRSSISSAVAAEADDGSVPRP
jgi:hypothetical protein